MAGVELTVGGWFATSIIRNVIDTARSYLGKNYHLQTGTAEVLTRLENSLPRVQAAIEEASKRPVTNRGLIKWLDDLKNAAYEVQDVLDDLEAKEIHRSLKKKNNVIGVTSSLGKLVKNLIFSDKELEGLKFVVDKFSTISMGVGDFVYLLNLEYKINANMENTNTNRRETSSYLNHNAKIFGRDMEIYLILDMIMNQFMCFPEGNSNEREVRGFSRFLGAFRGFWNYGATLRETMRSCLTNNIEEANFPTNNASLTISISTTLNLVCIKNWKLPVLPICGLGGVGKTTIAKMVFNNEIVEEGFHLRAWVYVSETFDIKRIMIKILNSLRCANSNYTMMNSDTIPREVIEWELIKTIKDKRFFLVLDDVHDGIGSIWGDLISVFKNSAPNSFILVTTQSEHVAKILGNMPINMIKLDLLEPEWFQVLFEYYAFGEQPFNLEEEKFVTLKLIARKIAVKLHGLPLAGEVIGKMLNTRLERVYWENILENDWWKNERALEGILPSLGVGYECLDPELKQCFKFCSIFPKHYVFDRQRLVQMWLAHDFIQPRVEERSIVDIEEIRLEDIGSKWFDKLVDRSFFQATISDGMFVMHDLIRELAIVVSTNEFCYVKSLDNHIPSFARHLGINCGGSNIEGTRQNNTNLRTVILFGNWKKCADGSISNIFAKSNSLRLLDLSYIGIETNAPSDAICRLSHLRFLDLSFSGIKLIPDKFCQLYHLQVLDIRGCIFQKLPKDINNLINLRHLYASADIVNGISGIGKLTKLQELEEFRVRDREGHRISELREMNEIRGHLLITNLEDVSRNEEAAQSQLDKKKYLKSLKLQFNCPVLENSVELEVLEALKPSPSVEKLTIEGCRAEYLPNWISQNEISYLKCITVRHFELITLPALGELPFLEFLCFNELKHLETMGDEFYGHNDVVFPSLKELQLSCMPRWRTWSDAPAQRKLFPHLKQICMEKCQQLIEIPNNCFTSSMVELKFFECPSIGNITTVLQNMSSLTQLSIDTCCNELSINCTALRFLEVLCLSKVENLFFVGGLKSLVNLRKLEIKNFDKIHELYEGEQRQDETSQEYQFFTSLHLSSSNNSTQRLPIAGRFGYLRSLLIRNSPIKKFTEEEERWLNQLISLETLEFSNCRHLTRLPSTLSLLSKLKKLSIKDCRMISSLPEFSLPPYLFQLYINGCSYELEQRCQPDKGDDWWKISHIPHIQIDRYLW